MSKWDKLGRLADQLLAGTRAGQIVRSDSKGANMIGLPQGLALQQNWAASMTTTQRTALSDKQRAWIATSLFDSKEFMGKNDKLSAIAEISVEELSSILAKGLRITPRDSLKVAGEMITFVRGLLEDFDNFRRRKIASRTLQIFIEESGLQQKTPAFREQALATLMSDSPYKLTDRYNAPINPLWAVVALQQLQQQ